MAAVTRFVLYVILAVELSQSVSGGPHSGPSTPGYYALRLLLVLIFRKAVDNFLSSQNSISWGHNRKLTFAASPDDSAVKINPPARASI
jgi:hypothetical protein